MSLVNHTVQIVQAYLTRNELASQNVAGLIQEVHRTLSTLSGSGHEAPAAPLVGKATNTEPPREAAAPPAVKNREDNKPQPAVPLNQAVTNDEVVCLLCGQRVKTLRGHLTRSHEINADEYRNMFNLEKNFPLVAPSYSERRRKLAQDSGLSEKLRAGRRKKLDAAAALKAAAAS